MHDDTHPYRELVRYGTLVLLAALIAEIAFEAQRASTAVQGWICVTAPTPAGPQACESAFVLRWMTARLPLYVVGFGAAAIVLSAGSMALRSARFGAGGFPWNRLLRILTVIVCLIALSELIACAGDASCGLSVSCA